MRVLLHVFAATFLFCAPAVAGTRLLVSATHDGKPVRGAEACFYAAVRENPLHAFERLEIRCFPADEAVEMPSEPRAVFVRAGERLITRYPRLLTPGSTDPRQHAAELSVGGHLVLRRPLRDGEQVGLIAGEGPESHGFVAPLLVEGQRALVPSDVAMIPVLFRNGQPVRTGPRIQVGPRGEGEIDFADGLSTPADVIVSFVATDPFAAPQLMGLLRKQEPPLVELVDHDGTIHRPQMVVRRTPDLLETPYVFRAVDPGRAVLRVSGRRIVTAETGLQIPEKGVLLAPDAGRIVIGAEVAVTVPSGGGGITPSPKQCDATVPADSVTERHVGYWACPGGLGNVLLSPAALSRCEQKERRLISEDGGTVSFPGVTPGEFLVVSERAGVITEITRGTSAAGETAEVTVDANELFVMGRIVRDDKPAQARVIFHTGEGVSSPDTGEYAVLLSDAPRRHPVYVVACDDSWAYVHFPRTDVPAGAGYDITIPANHVEITVRDAATNGVLESAKIVALARPSEDARGGGQLPVSSADGVHRLEHLDEDTILSICASLTTHKTKCVDATVRDGRQALTITLEAAAYRGRVTAQGYSHITWARPDGSIVEQRNIDSDGRFTYSSPWKDGHAVLTGSAPLFATTSSTYSEEGELIIAPPAAPTKAVRFSIAPSYSQEKVLLGVWINGLRIPMRVLGEHQRQRRQPWFVTKDRPLILSDIFATDTIAIVAGPDLDLLPPGGLDNPMIFAGRAPIEVRTPDVQIE